MATNPLGLCSVEGCEKFAWCNWNGKLLCRDHIDAVFDKYLEEDIIEKNKFYEPKS
jgi:hypothetical protein